MKILKIILLFSILFYPALAGIESLYKASYASGYRIYIDVIIEDQNFIETARVYFKSQKNEKYKFFSSMKCTKGLCRGTLPAPIDSTNKIYYSVIYSNKLHKVFRSEELVMKQKEMLILGQNQTKDKTHFVVNTEFENAPSSIVGFSDDFSIAKVQKYNRIGVLVDMLDKEEAGIKNISSEIRSEYGGNASTTVSPILIGALIVLLIAL